MSPIILSIQLKVLNIYLCLLILGIQIICGFLANKFLSFIFFEPFPYISRARDRGLHFQSNDHTSTEKQQQQSHDKAKMASYDDDENFGNSGSYSVVGSFPKEFGYSEDREDLNSHTDEQKPKILLMGLRRSGKSSILKVVFHKMSPNETLFLESTNKIVKDDISNSSFVQFRIWDFPGQIDFFGHDFDSDQIFSGCGSLVFVIDAQDDYMDALTKLHQTVTRAYKVNPNIKFEVFIHKVDGLTDDHKIETQRDIHQRATGELEDAGLENLQLSFYLTSIYDHSVFEAFSKVVQKLIVQLPTLENLLNILIQHSGIEKAFLFDVVSKIYIATDSAPVDMQSYELCCDMIDVVIDISCIYGMRDNGDANAYDTESASVIRLNNSTVCYLREVNRYLALVCILREENFCKHGLIDYNFHCFRQAIQEVFEIRQQSRDAVSSKNDTGRSSSLKGEAVVV